MITKENITILLGFILGTIIAAGIIFFIVIGFSMVFGIIPTNKSTEMMGSEPVGPGGGGGRIDLIEYECFINGAYYPSSSGKCSIDTSGWENTTVSSLWDNTTYYNNTMAPNWAPTPTYTPNTNYYVAGWGGGNRPPELGCPSSSINWTVEEEAVKKLGEKCRLWVCGWWVGYKTQGFYNLTGVYYDNGTPTGMTLKQMATLEELNGKYRYEQQMNEKGLYYDGKKWHGNGL